MKFSLAMRLTAFLIGMCLASNGFSAESSIDLKALFKNASQLIFCESVLLDETWVYRRIKTPPLQGDKVDEALNQILTKGRPVGDFPGIGIFTHLVLVDEEGAPLAVLDLVTFKGTVVISGCVSKGESFVARPLSSSADWVIIESPAFAKIIYDWVAKENPGFLEERQKGYSEMGFSFEKLLFEGDASSTKPKE